MVIFHVLKHTMYAAGNVCAAIDLACAQAKRGHKVYVCSSVGSFAELLSRNGVEYIEINQMGNGATVLRAAYQLHRMLRAIRPDIVHAHMMTSAVLMAMLRPLIGFKLVTSVHNEFQRSAILMAVGQRVIGVSEAVSRSMIRRGVSPSRMRTVLNGTIHSARRPEPAPPPLPLRRPAVVTVGGMHPRKGMTDLIDAFGIVLAGFPEAHLYLVGSGPMEDEYKERARKVSADHICFFGHLDDPRPVLLASDIFVLASRAEPAGLVISEAREAGCAIVASNVGGIPEMVDNGKAGLLVEPGQPELLAATLLRLLRDPPQLAQMRARSRTNLGYFTMDRVTADIERVYGELLPLASAVTASS